MTKSTGTGRGGARPGSGPKPSGLNDARFLMVISRHRLKVYREYLAGYWDRDVTDAEVIDWVRDHFKAELERLDELTQPYNR